MYNNNYYNVIYGPRVNTYRFVPRIVHVVGFFPALVPSGILLLYLRYIISLPIIRMYIILLLYRGVNFILGDANSSKIHGLSDRFFRFFFFFLSILQFRTRNIVYLNFIIIVINYRKCDVSITRI